MSDPSEAVYAGNCAFCNARFHVPRGQTRGTLESCRHAECPECKRDVSVWLSRADVEEA